MIGMLQIITYLLCVYLVFKGIEIFQIAMANNGNFRIPCRVLGIVAVLASIFLAFYFTHKIDTHANSVSEGMKYQEFQLRKNLFR